MNNKYFFFAFCMLTLAFAPACKKKQTSCKKNDTNSMIDTSGIAIETNEKDSVIKF